MLLKMKTHEHDYHADLELSDGVGGDSRFGYPLEIALGVIELARAR